MNKPLIILDRDGVINQDSDDYIKCPAEWLPIESSLTAIARLTRAGYNVAVATNQSGLARNFFTTDTLAEIHAKMLAMVKLQGGHIVAIEYCPDHPDNAGPDRKPGPGMANRLLKQFNAVAEDTWFVGDSLADLGCALNSGCKPALVLTGKGRHTHQSDLFDSNIPVFDNLYAFTDKILT